MLKVSFKDTPEKPAKIVCRSDDKVTTVHLHGTLELELKIIPPEVVLWLFKHPFTDGTKYGNKLSIDVTGTAKRADGDVDNPILAERIAEARAKIKIYRFMKLLLKRICKVYYSTLYGKTNSMPTMGWGGLFGKMTRYSTLLRLEREHLNELLEKA